MDKKKLGKGIGIAVDVLMYAIMLVQMVYVFTGNIVHEVLGIGFFVCLAAHIIIKRKYLTGLFRFKGKSPIRAVSNAVTLLLLATSAALMPFSALCRMNDIASSARCVAGEMCRVDSRSTMDFALERKVRVWRESLFLSRLWSVAAASSPSLTWSG